MTEFIQNVSIMFIVAVVLVNNLWSLMQRLDRVDWSGVRAWLRGRR